MNHPIFHPNEPARIGPYAYDRRMVGQDCTIEGLMTPLAGEHRYGVSTKSGMATIMLESTLQKRFERGDWRGCDWRPRRETR